MSQSDYIQYKKVANELRINETADSVYPVDPVFNSRDYTDFKSYALETTVSNTKLNYNQLIPTGKKIIFNMEKNTSNCPTFPLCTNTNTRSNRVILGGSRIGPWRNLRPLEEKVIAKTITELPLCACSKI
jgi:hypothetical protein